MSKSKITGRYVISHNGEEHQILENGEVVFENRMLKGIDFGRFQKQAQSQFDKLRRSYPERTHLHPSEDKIHIPSFAVIHNPERK